MSRNRWRRSRAAALLAAALLAGCKDEKKDSAPAAASMADHAREAAEQATRSAPGVPKVVWFRGVQVYAQAAPQRMAVCGLVNPFADDPNIFVPFVTIVSWQGVDGRPASYALDQRIGTSTSEASRVYVALVASCYEGGGPSRNQGVTPMPPIPDNIPDPATSGVPPNPPLAAAMPKVVVPGSPQPAGGSPAAGSVTTRQNANLHADPHGPTVRTVPQGTVLRVFSQAPGGWYQVGDTAPQGWLHESMLDRH
jgi:hypothetical protein